MIYLDNAATTKPFAESMQAMVDIALQNYGNPSSLHKLGVSAASCLQSCREHIGNMAGISADQIIFTSGATEANQMVLKCGIRNSNKNRNHILMTSIEHSSNLAAIPFLKANGYEVEFLIPDEFGNIQPLELQKKIRPTTELVSIIGVHNELGTIQEIAKLQNLIKSMNPKTLFHVDAVQWFGKFPLPSSEQMPDYLTFSGHKLHAPRGIGGVIKKSDSHLKPLIEGGGQENKLRSGTENLPAIVALIESLKMLASLDRSSLPTLQEILYRHVTSNTKYHWLGNPPGPKRSPYINSIVVKNNKSEILIHKLENKNIFVSSGSACSEKTMKNQKNRWKFLNINDPWLDNILRISFSVHTTQNEVEEFLKELDQIA